MVSSSGPAPGSPESNDRQTTEEPEGAPRTIVEKADRRTIISIPAIIALSILIAIVIVVTRLI